MHCDIIVGQIVGEWTQQRLFMRSRVKLTQVWFEQGTSRLYSVCLRTCIIVLFSVCSVGDLRSLVKRLLFYILIIWYFFHCKLYYQNDWMKCGIELELLNVWRFFPIVLMTATLKLHELHTTLHACWQFAQVSQTAIRKSSINVLPFDSQIPLTKYTTWCTLATLASS